MRYINLKGTWMKRENQSLVSPSPNKDDVFITGSEAVREDAMLQVENSPYSDCVRNINGELIQFDHLAEVTRLVAACARGER